MEIETKNLNFKIAHAKTELDDRITPLAAAAFLNRVEILELFLENDSIDLNLTTEDNGTTFINIVLKFQLKLI